MEIEFMWKTGDSNTGNCPAMYAAPGGYVVQGKMLDDATRAQLRDLGGDETAVFVPADVIDRIRNAA
jgi:ADP-ribose pyrophosphatase YjhB (NUDIX family)